MPPHEAEIGSNACQICCVQRMSAPIGEAGVVQQSLRQRLKLMLKRRLNPRAKRSLKVHSKRIIDRFLKLTGRSKVPLVPATNSTTTSLKAGDLVRIRSREEIQATLDYWKELKGCLFFPEMWAYCGTTQRVLKPVRRIVDERDYQVKKCKGVVLLEEAICEGTELFGSCDRSCFFFWREEWLEKID
jgi:hypothetical protein